MRGKKFGWVLSAASALGALLGMIFMSSQMARATNTPGERALWVGAFFLMLFVFGFCGIQLAMLLSRTYKVERQPLWWAAFLLACALVFGIGAGGQYLFMYSREEVMVSAEVDMVLLLDASGSMDTNGYTAPRTEAACQFVDSLDEDCRLQVMSFAGRVLDSSQMLTMDSANKNVLKQMISLIDAYGSTDFNEPLQMAMDTLNGQSRPNCNKAVILLTDGESNLDAGIVNAYVGSDIRVFSIRISSKSNLDADAQALADFAKSTGGFDAQLTPNPDGSINTGDMLKAFQDAFKATSDTEIKMSEDLIVHAKDGVTIWQFLIRALVIVLCAIAIGFGYFGVISLPSVVSSGIMGLVAAILVTVLEGAGYALCALVIVLLIETAYVFLDLRGEDHFDV